jgi:hypothetical protein
VPTNLPRRVALAAAAVCALFAFRLAYGLSSEFHFEDETQIYLIGLRYYAKGLWPYFGPDVVWTESQIPGALQGLLVGIPLRIAAVPEAPHVLLNLLSMVSLAVFCWYVTRRLPALPPWLVWGWLMTVPWTLELSTHVLNSSYVLTASLMFFVGFFEAVPAFRRALLPQAAAFAVMGAAAAWVAQVHMSWVLLLPYAALAWIAAVRDRPRVSSAIVNAVAFGGGLLVFGALVIPTFLTYGLHAGSGGTLRSFRPHWVNPGIVVTTVARFFSFASLEIWRFLSPSDGGKVMFLLNHLWIVPLAVVAWAAGIWQPIWMLREWCRAQSPYPEWRPLKWLVAGTILMISAAYTMVLEPQQAHAFYVTAPLAFMFAAYCWTFVDSPRWRRVAAGLLAVNIAFHLGQAWIQAPVKSMYHNRQVVVEALRQKEPQIFGHRRPFAIDGAPYAVTDPSRPYDSRQDIKFTEEQVVLKPRRVVLWDVTLRNTNERVAFRDVLYRTHYRDEQGRVVEERHEVIKDIFQPGTATRLIVNDGIVRTPFASATIEVLRAEALLPAR